MLKARVPWYRAFVFDLMSRWYDTRVSTGEACYTASRIDFCVQELGCSIEDTDWAAFQALLHSCGWLIGGPRTCLICERPLIALLDEKGRFHADARPALVCLGGLDYYFCHGIVVPPELGSLPMQQWDPHWILDRYQGHGNTSLRKALIEGIGEQRLREVLGLEPIDSYGDFTVVRIKGGGRIAQIHSGSTIYDLIKAPCASAKKRTSGTTALSRGTKRRVGHR
ncbi:hypothetical protein HC891_17925, partial [Candidatus Gracilibacteria bacterium]|nr:hypothetical protein [Candidatus Gracilibacteria bacterium]